MRPLNLFQATIAVLVTGALIPVWPDLPTLLLTILVVVSVNGGANVLNDWFDYPIDKVNRPSRPIVSGAISRSGALVFAIILFAVGIITAFQLAPIARNIAVFVAIPLLILYTPFFKGMPLAGNLVVAAVLGMTFLFAGSAFGYLEYMIIPAALAAGFTVVRELIKDIEDYAGDQAEQIGTFPVLFGVKKGVILGRVLVVLLMFGCLWPYLMGYYGAYYLITLTFGVEIPLLYVLAYLKHNPSPLGCAHVARILKIDVFGGLLAVYLSNFDV
ncbi:UbiA family prenyltransferase [Candidatus Neomarinimicrobiota bacterium]